MNHHNHYDSNSNITKVKNKGLPSVRTWELDENSTRFEKLVAAPSDEALRSYWSAWTVIAFLVGIFSSLVFISILSSRKARRNPFNIYLIYTMLPDFVFSFCCAITCGLNVMNGEYWSQWMCGFQQWYCVFGIGSNAWMNAIITHQLYKMLRYSYQRRKFIPPTRKDATKHAVAVYLYNGFLGTWGVIGAKNWPLGMGPYSGLACLPIELNRRSSFFFWLCFFPLFVGIPMGYVAYACYDVWKRKLLPPSGKRRLLVVYFGRLVCAFWIMWLPTMFFLFIIPSFVGTWVHFAGGTLSHLQGAVSAFVSLLKPDILSAFKSFMTCNCWEEAFIDNDQHENSSIMRRYTTLVGSGSFIITSAGSLFTKRIEVLLGAPDSSRHSSCVDDTQKSLPNLRSSSMHAVEYADNSDVEDDDHDDHQQENEITSGGSTTTNNDQPSNRISVRRGKKPSRASRIEKLDVCTEQSDLSLHPSETEEDPCSLSDNVSSQKKHHPLPDLEQQQQLQKEVSKSTVILDDISGHSIAVQIQSSIDGSSAGSDDERSNIAEEEEITSKMFHDLERE